MPGASSTGSRSGATTGIRPRTPTQKNWCAAAGVERVQTLSDAFDGNFGLAYGVMIKECRWFWRAVWVVDRDDKVVYSEYTSGLGVKPDYEAVLATARAAL